MHVHGCLFLRPHLITKDHTCVPMHGYSHLLFESPEIPLKNMADWFAHSYDLLCLQLNKVNRSYNLF